MRHSGLKNGKNQKMQLFYISGINEDTQQIAFDKTESKHIVKVLRKKKGDTVYITNGRGLLLTSKIDVASDKKCLVNVFNCEKKNKSRDYQLHLAVAPTKNNERLEWFLEKATEIGIDEITPMLTQNSERRMVKKKRLEKVIIAAMKQSLKFHLPTLNEPISFDEFLRQKSDQNIYIAHCREGMRKTMKEVVKPSESSTILIGPEGDFSQEEVTEGIRANFTPISLGNSRLRTETAALVAVQNIAFINE